MEKRNFTLWVLVLILLSGCGSSFNTKWKNFNAYYNTFHNAQKSYNTGLVKNLGQEREYNPLQPIRIHPAPLNAGASDFEKAIQKGADVLRRHNESKWVDDALALIGKSYYFKREYFSADQKFTELYITSKSEDLKQEAVIWRGRVLLEMERYNEGISYLIEEMTLLDKEWSKTNRAEAQAMLAQHYVKLQNWQTAANLLTEAIPELPEKAYKERGYFLLGQIYEQLNDRERGFEAYNNVQKYYVDYRLQYLSQRKTAEVARDLGRYDTALKIFNSMVRDDKNLEYKSELDFELARTEYERNNYKRAEELYNQVLHRNLLKPSVEIQARSYYGLAEIFRFQYDDFKMAAAYYDSAAQKKVSAERLPDGFKASELADSFGAYARIKNEIAKQDSLLALGLLTPEQLDSALTVLRAKKMEELRQLKKQEESLQNRLVTVNDNNESNNAGNSNNGFLNEKNPVTQGNIRNQFIAVWGNRPLADNWRVRSMIQLSVENQVNGNEFTQNITEQKGTELVSIEIDLSEVPFTEQEQDSVRKLISAQQYELGNLFYLSIDLPDSAVYHFNEAIQGPSEENINILSLYSLSELYTAKGQGDKARSYGMQLIEKYPSSLYAQRISEKLDLRLDKVDELVNRDPMQVYSNIMDSDTLGNVEKAKALSQLALNNTEEIIAPRAQYDAIQFYMKEGMQEPSYENLFIKWNELQEQWKQDQVNFKSLQDSAKTMLSDTLTTEGQREIYQSILDSTLTKPSFSKVFPYNGPAWDQARTAVDTFLVAFDASELVPQVIRIKNELEILNDERRTIKAADEPKPVANNPSNGFINCTEIDQELRVRGGLQRLLDQVQLSGNYKLNELIYQFKVNQRGIVESYQLKSEDIPKAVSDAYEKVIEEALTFEPVLFRGQAVSVQCDLSFPVKN